MKLIMRWEQAVLYLFYWLWAAVAVAIAVVVGRKNQMKAKQWKMFNKPCLVRLIQ